MLAIKVELLHGTIRAGSPDDTALAGGAAAGEWPPSPARLFSALVAADGTRSRCAVTDGNELAWLEALGPPTIYASSPSNVLQAQLKERFVVVPETAEGSTQDYPGRRALPVRPGVRQAPKDEVVTYVWASAGPATELLNALRKRAARIGYLGCADSPVRVSVVEDLNGQIPDAWIPDSESTFTLPIPYAGFMAELDVAFDQWTDGQPVRRSWIRTVRSGYMPPGLLPPMVETVPHVIWLRFDRSISGRKLVAVTATLRNAVLDHVQRLLGREKEIPPVLHGHRSNGEQGPQARFLALPHVGYGRADGRLLGAAVWLPAATDPAIIQIVRTAIAKLSAQRLTKLGWFEIGVSQYADERSPWASNPRRWNRPARRWISATPVIHERWTKGVPDLDEVSRWCEHANLPHPISVCFQRQPFLRGALDLHPSLVFREGKDRRPYSHVQIQFETAVRGPVVLGRGRQFGLGLMAPADAPEGERDD